MHTFDGRIVPAASVNSVDEGLRLAEALLAGGLKVLEITFRTPAAGAAIKAITANFRDIVVGAGTVLTEAQLDEALAGGAHFAVAPGLDETLVAVARKASIVFVPGVATPTEVSRAIGCGCRLLKFFPAEALGGVETLTAMAGPFGHLGVKFMPTGGITAGNAASYLKLPSVIAVGGSWMVSRAAMDAGDWAGITRLSREAVALGAAAG